MNRKIMRFGFITLPCTAQLISRQVNKTHRVGKQRDASFPDETNMTCRPMTLPSIDSNFK